MQEEDLNERLQDHAPIHLPPGMSRVEESEFLRCP